MKRRKSLTEAKKQQATKQTTKKSKRLPPNHPKQDVEATHKRNGQKISKHVKVKVCQNHRAPIGLQTLLRLLKTHNTFVIFGCTLRCLCCEWQVLLCKDPFPVAYPQQHAEVLANEKASRHLTVKLDTPYEVNIVNPGLVFSMPRLAKALKELLVLRLRH